MKLLAVLVALLSMTAFADDAGDMREGVQLLFDTWDSNSDGVLTADEQGFIKEADQNGDDQIDLLELLSHMMPRDAKVKTYPEMTHDEMIKKSQEANKKEEQATKARKIIDEQNLSDDYDATTSVALDDDEDDDEPATPSPKKEESMEVEDPGADEL